MAIFPNTRAGVQLRVTVTREALEILLTMRMTVGVVGVGGDGDTS